MNNWNKKVNLRTGGNWRKRRGTLAERGGSLGNKGGQHGEGGLPVPMPSSTHVLSSGYVRTLCSTLGRSRFIILAAAGESHDTLMS